MKQLALDLQLEEARGVAVLPAEVRKPLVALMGEALVAVLEDLARKEPRRREVGDE